MPSKKIFLIIDHPDQVINPLVFKRYFPDQEFHLLINNHSYWKKNTFDFLKYRFASVTFISRVRFSWFLPIEFIKILFVRRRLLNLNINKKDVFIVFSNAILLEAILLSLYKKTSSFFLIYPDHRFSPAQYEEKNISKIWGKTLIPFFKLPNIKYYRNKSEFALERIRYEKGRGRIFKRWIKIERNFSKKIKKDQIYSLTPLICKKRNTLEQKKKIVFFGASHQKSNLYHFNFTNKCLRSLEKWYPNREFIYKPHPHDICEKTNIQLGKFKLYNGGLNTELYLLEIIKDVEFCFSIESSSVAIALFFNIPSYWFSELYKSRSAVFKKQNQKILSFIPANAYLKLWKKPKKIVLKIPYNWILQSLEKIKQICFEK